MGLSISASQGRVAQYHDEREYIPNNVDERLRVDNKTLVKQDCSYHEAFNKLFQGSVDEYNAKQKRESRKIKDYYESLKESDRREKPIYEYVFQIGNHETNGVTCGTEDEAKAREALDAAMSKLQEKYPALHFMFIGSHGDEPNGTYHYHVAFTPVGKGYKNGMTERCSLTKALNSMGFKTRENDGLAIEQWQNDVKDLIEEEMLQRGLEREYMGNTDKHLSVSNYKRKKRLEALEERERSVMAREKELNAMQSEAEDNLKKAKDEADSALDAVLDLHKQVQDDEIALNARETSLKAQEDALRAERDDFTLEKEKWLKEQAMTYLRQKKKLDEDREKAQADIIEQARKISEDLQRKYQEFEKEKQTYKQTLQEQAKKQVQDFYEQLKKDIEAPYKRTGRAVPTHFQDVLDLDKKKIDEFHLTM